MHKPQVMHLSVIMLLLAIPQLVCAEPYRLGFSGPLSGPGAGWGNDIKNVLIFASEKLAEGRYAFVFEDDRCEPKGSATAAQKLVNIDKVREVFVVCGQAVLATASTYRRAGITVMAPLATPSRISELGVFRTSLSDALAAQRLAAYIAARHHTVYVLTEENDYPEEFLKDFLRYGKEAGLAIEGEHYQGGQFDFRSQLLKLKRKNTEAFFLNTQTENALLSLVQQLKELAMTPKLYGAYLPGSAGFLKAAGPLADGIEFVDFPGAPELLNEEGKKLYAEYLNRFGPLQGWSFAFPAAFEAFRAMHLALLSREPVAQYLHKTAFEGIIGRYSFSPQGDLMGVQHAMRRIRKGQAEAIP